MFNSRAIVAETSIAVFAREWTLSCMTAHMALKFAFGKKLIWTNAEANSYVMYVCTELHIQILKTYSHCTGFTPVCRLRCDWK